jgi:tripartite-type tricarboxylate transporter receptor subunit TctC
MNALVAGQVPCGFVASAGVLPHVKAGQLRALAVSSSTRTPLAPDVPTIAESGYPGFSIETYFLFEAPAGLPEDIAKTLFDAARDAMAAPDVQKRLRSVDLTPMATTSAEAKARLASDRELWAGVVKAAHMHID